MGFLGFLAVGLLLIAGCHADALLENGQEYQFSYFASTVTGVRDPAPFQSAFAIKANLLVQQNAGFAVVKLSEASLGLHNGPESTFGSVNYLKKPELSVLEKPFKISYSGGKVTGFDADASDPEWSINIKKGIATALQVDDNAINELGNTDVNYYTTLEETITGSCNTSYSFGAAEKGTFTIIKQRSMKDCTNVPRFSFNTFGASNCAGQLQDEVLATTQAYYRLQRDSKNKVKPLIIGSLGYQVLQWNPPDGAPIYNLANQTLLFKSSGPIVKPMAIQLLTKHYNNLVYGLKRKIPNADEIELTREEDFLHPEDPKPQDALRSKTIETIKQLLKVYSSSPTDDATVFDPTILQATTLMGTLSLQSLQSVLTSVSNDEQLKALFIELLPMAGSNPAAMLVKEMVLNGKMNDAEARRAVTYVPYYLRLPSEKLLTEYEALLKDNPNIKTKELRGAIALSFSHLVGVTCSKKVRSCRADTIAKYSKMAVEGFKAAKTHPEQMVALQALRNTGLQQALERMVPFTKPGAVSRALRPHVFNTISGLGSTNRKLLLSACMPVILNDTETTDIRIAAIVNVFYSGPTFLELQQIVAGMLWERNPEVLNFVVTTFKSTVDTKNPCVKPISNNLQLLLRRIAHVKANPFRSNNRMFDFYDTKYSFGGGLRVATVYGEESRVPLIIVGSVNYRVSEWGYVPLEVFIRLEGVEDTYVRLFRKLDPKEFKLDTLKDILQKTMKITPRSQAPMKVELMLRSQGYTLMYRHVGEEDLKGIMEGKGLGEIIVKGLKYARNMVLLGGQHVSWRSNDIGIPVGVGLTNPGFARIQMAYGDAAQPKKIARTLNSDFDLTLQAVTYLVAYNPLGVSQGIMKARGSRLHLPINLLVSYSPADKQSELKIGIPTEDKPLSALFSAKTIAFMFGKDDKKGLGYLKESCSSCESQALVSKGDDYRKGQVFRENTNKVLGMESDVEVYDCETYTGKSSMGRVIFNSFKPSEINSHGSIPGYLLMGFMQMRNYFYYYPPTATCSMKAKVHQASTNPGKFIDIKLKYESGPGAGKKPTPGKVNEQVKGTVSILGEPERKWNVDVQIEAEPFNVRSSVNVKVARLAVPSLSITNRALCVNVKTIWAPLPEDIFETPSPTEPSVSREVTFVWGDAAANECPKVGAKDVSSLVIKAQGKINEAQRKAATERTEWPYNKCDADRKADGRSGIVGPMTQACYEAVMHYATPRSYVFDINYDQLSARGMKALYRIDAAVKTSLIAYWDMHPPHDAHGITTVPAKKAPNSGHIELKIDFDDDAADIHLHTDHIHNHFENVEVLDPLDNILRNARLPLSTITYVKSGLLGICDVAPTAIVSLDNVTMHYKLPSCWTLASADCSQQPRYAAFVKKSGQNLPVAAKIYIGGHSIEMNPTSSSVEVKVNDKAVKIESAKPHVVGDKENIIQYAVISKVGDRYFIQSPALKLTFRYTGDDVTMFIPSTYRAQHCGLCGDFNGQFSRELVGPSGCSLATANDLANAYVLKDKSCKENIAAPTCVSSGAGGSGRNPASIVQFLDQFSHLTN